MRCLRVLIWSAALLPLFALSADSPNPDPWATVRFSQEKNKAGEVHEHWSLLSYDRMRKVLPIG
jgi:hypothetical protein